MVQTNLGMKDADFKYLSSSFIIFLIAVALIISLLAHVVCNTEAC